MPVHVLTHPACLDHDTPDGRDHVERPDRLRAARSGLRERGVSFEEGEAPEVRVVQLTDVHPPDHVDVVRQGCQQGRWFDTDTYARPESWEAALRSAGAARKAAALALEGEPALALTRPPGHHATANRAMGFCLFNNVAVAAQWASQQGVRVAVVDVDVHHGNGTQDLFYGRDDVLYISIHQSPLYPGTGHAHETGRGAGQGYTVNLPIPSGTGHEGWLELVDRVVLPVVERFDPGLVLVSAGFDAHRLDPLGGLSLVAPTFHGCVERLGRLQPRVAAVLEGGYSLEALERCVPATVAALGGRACPVEESPVEGLRPWSILRSPVETYHGEQWGVGGHG